MNSACPGIGVVVGDGAVRPRRGGGVTRSRAELLLIELEFR